MRWIRQKLSRKLGVAFCLVVGASLFFADLVLVRRFRAHLTQQLQQNLLVQSRQLAAVLPEPLFERRDPAWQPALEKIERQTGARVTILDASGSVLLDSRVPLERIASVENHARRPEVAQALSHGAGYDVRTSETVMEPLIYVAVRAPRAGILRQAISLADLNRQMSEFRRLALASTLASVALGLLLVLALTRWMTAPLNRIHDVVLSIIYGGPSRKRVPVSTEDEVGRLAEAFNQMMARLDASMEQLRSEKEELSAILTGMVEQVIAVDGAGRVVLINPAAESLFGIRSADAVGRPFVETVRQAAVHDALSAVLSAGQERAGEIRLFFPEERAFEVRAVPLRGAEGKNGALLVLHDITRIQKLEQVRRDFIANVSHELRTPLTSIQGFAETLLDGALNDPAHAREFVETIHGQARRLSGLVNDLLDLSAIESGKVRPKLGAVSLRPLASEVGSAVQPQADKRGCGLRIEIPAEFPPVLGDPGQIKQVLTNLLDNAIKFNKPGGSVLLRAELAAERARIEVRDTGSGIPEKDLPRVFERFYRVDKARSRELGGTGLGLAIVKHIVEAHGGSVRVESAVDRGSSFFVELPLFKT